MLSDQLINLKAGFLQSKVGATGRSPTDRREYLCRFVAAGRIRGADNAPSEIEVMPEALQSASDKKLFDSCACFIDHAGWFDNPSLRNLVGVTFESYWDVATQSIEGKVRLNGTPDSDVLGDLLDDLLEDQSSGAAVPDLGLSIVFWPVWATPSDSPPPGGGGAGGEVSTRKITDIKHVESVDFVFMPAASGRVLEALSALSHPPLGEGLPTPPSPLGEGLPTPPSTFSKGNSMSAKTIPEIPEVPNTSVGSSPLSVHGEGPGVGSPTQLWLESLAEASASAMIASSTLPEASKTKLRAQKFTSPDQVRDSIESEQAYLATLIADNVVQIGGIAPRSPNIQVGRNSLEKIAAAFEALMFGLRPPDGIQPLSGVRELYHLLSGDYEMTGIFQSERIQFANVTSSTMANLVANVLNKVVVGEFQQYPMWWEPIVNVTDFGSLQDVRWMFLGGVGELPTVAEGAAYTELTWDDKYESSTFVKKGGYLGITIEAIDKDDTARLRAAPRALAQAAWLTLSKAVSTIFTVSSGVGPTLADTLALFHTTHANLGTTALSLTTWAAARLAMRKQTELNSAERLGALTTPKYLLVPPDLEPTAVQILASELDYTYALSNAPAAPINPNAEGDGARERLRIARERIIVVDLWTDANDWAAVCDPRLYPTIGLGFRYGRQPEIFSVASPTAGLMFSNDTMPVKVRFFFAVGPVDYRGMYKANV